jgi:pantoate--beta-alanine ligase
MSGSDPLKVVKSVAAMQTIGGGLRRQGIRLGFVPTMGKLHQGHLSLVRGAMADADQVVVSIFVNPTQFGPGEDFNRYPRNLEADLELLRAEGVSLCFVPEVAEIYPPGDDTRIEMAWGGDVLCSVDRPAHFTGVCNVVARLLNIVQPAVAWFGQKDAQQSLVIKRMVTDLHFPVELKLGAIVRESDGLAMSSRNSYLDPDQRRVAVGLFQALEDCGEALRLGMRDSATLAMTGLSTLTAAGLQPEYFELLDPLTLTRPDTIGEGLLLVACAVRVGVTRLIDNHVFMIGANDVRETRLF